MSLKKDKKKVLGEIFDEERIKSFLDVEGNGEIDTDYLTLERAYRGMNAENFGTFVQLFSQEGRNLEARNPDGKTLRQVISEHHHGGDYSKALESVGVH